MLVTVIIMIMIMIVIVRVIIMRVRVRVKMIIIIIIKIVKLTQADFCFMAKNKVFDVTVGLNSPMASQGV